MKPDNNKYAEHRKQIDHYIPLEDFYSIIIAIREKYPPTHLHYEVMLYIAYFMGLRAVEIRYIQIQDINLDKQTLLIRNAKNNAIVEKPIPNNVFKVLNKYIGKYRHKFHKDGYIFTGVKRTYNNYCVGYLAYRNMFYEYLKAAGLENKEYRLHSLRYSFITNFYTASKDLIKTQRAARHIALRSTLPYLVPQNNFNEKQILDIISPDYF